MGRACRSGVGGHPATQVKRQAADACVADYFEGEVQHGEGGHHRGVHRGAAGGL